MKASELRDKSVDELNKELLDLAREQFNLRMQAASNDQLVQTHMLSRVKKDIARIKTVMSEKKRAENNS